MGHGANLRIALQCVLALTAVVLPYTTPSAQSQNAAVRTAPAVDTFIKDGVAELRDGKFDAALRKFNQASKNAPTDPRGWFFQGMAFNRLGQFRAAMQSLVRARALGFRAPQIDFEMGWGSLNIGFPKAAITHLTAYEKSSPGNAKTSEFLGRAYFALKQYDRAEARLREAIKRDPKAKSTALLYLARIQKARGKRKQASETLAGLLTESPNSSVGRDLREILAKRMARSVPGEPIKKPAGEKPGSSRLRYRRAITITSSVNPIVRLYRLKFHPSRRTSRERRSMQAIAWRSATTPPSLPATVFTPIPIPPCPISTGKPTRPMWNISID